MTARSALAAVVENVAAPLLVHGLLTLCGLGTIAALLGSAGFSALVVAVRAVRSGTVPMLAPHPPRGAPEGHGTDPAPVAPGPSR